MKRTDKRQSLFIWTKHFAKNTCTHSITKKNSILSKHFSDIDRVDRWFKYKRLKTFEKEIPLRSLHIFSHYLLFITDTHTHTHAYQNYATILNVFCLCVCLCLSHLWLNSVKGWIAILIIEFQSFSCFIIFGKCCQQNRASSFFLLFYHFFIHTIYRVYKESRHCRGRDVKWLNPLNNF